MNDIPPSDIVISFGDHQLRIPKDELISAELEPRILFRWFNPDTVQINLTVEAYRCETNGWKLPCNAAVDEPLLMFNDRRFS